METLPPTQTIALSTGAKVIVDAADYERLSAHKWQLSSWGYAKRSVRTIEGKRSIFMHREIVGLADAPKGVQVDHANGDILDNRRANLRVCTVGENRRNQRLRDDNTSGYKGVHWNKIKQRWQVYINRDGRRHSLGYYFDKEEAKAAYDAAAVQIHGAFAKTNEQLAHLTGCETVKTER